MYEIILCDEAQEQFNNLQKNEYKKAFKAFEKFEKLGKDGVVSRDLANGLFEIKSDNIRILYSYIKNKVIIVGLIFIKKTQKTPKRFIDKAIKNIEQAKRMLTNENI